jgi:hypothetical protein
MLEHSDAAAQGRARVRGMDGIKNIIAGVFVFMHAKSPTVIQRLPFNRRGFKLALAPSWLNNKHG